MKYLIDTHVFIWSLLEPKKISKKVFDILEDTEMKLNVRLILSLGSSMYGATRPEYNIFDIAGDAKDSGLVEYELLAVSRG